VHANKAAEQSELISRLATKDQSTTSLFRNAFAALLALVTIVLLALSNGSRRSASGTTLALAAISSCALGLLLQMDAPPPPPSPAPLDEQDGAGDGVQRRGTVDWRSRYDLRVLRRWMPRLNWALACILGLRILVRYVGKGAIVGADFDGRVEALAFGAFSLFTALRLWS
jgi:hypothetical protein